MKPQYIYEDLFGLHFYVSYGLKKSKWVQTVKDEWGIDLKNHNCSGRMISPNNGKRIYWIWTEIKDLSMLSHEILHAVVCALKDVGMSLHDKSEEAYCYLFQYIIKRIKI